MSGFAEHPPTPQDGEYRACRRIQERTPRVVPDYQDAGRNSQGCLIGRFGPLSQGDLQCGSRSIHVYLLLPYSMNENQEDCLGHPADSCMIAESSCERKHPCTAFDSVRLRETSAPVAQSRGLQTTDGER